MTVAPERGPDGSALVEGDDAGGLQLGETVGHHAVEGLHRHGTGRLAHAGERGERLRPVDVFDDAGLASSGAARRGRRVMDVRPAQ